MKQTLATSLLTSLLALSIVFASESLASADSTRGPLYVEGHVVGGTLGFSSAEPLFPGAPSVSTTAGSFAVELHGGYHVSGRHDGFVLGASQKLSFGTGTAAATLARLGWDFAIPAGKREVTIAPFAFGGALYGGGPSAGYFGFGVEGRFFPIEHEDVRDRPSEGPRRVVVAADRIEIREKIQFRQNEAIIEAVSFSLLEEIATVIKRNPQIEKIRIDGHASSEGDAAANEKLSDSRAKAVRAHLIERGGVSADQLEAKGFGAKRPIATNDSEEGRERNRRVEFTIVKQRSTVERVESASSNGGAGEGFFIVVKPLELGFVTASPSVTTLTFQAGVGYAF